VRGTPIATRQGVKFDASRHRSPQNHTLFRVETQPVDDTSHVDPIGIDAFGSELPEPVAPVSVASTNGPVASGAASRSSRSLVRALGVLALAEAFVIAGLLLGGASAFDARDGRLVIETDPSGAEVWLDGRYLGTTPLSVTADAGQRSLRFDAHGMSRTMTVEVVGGQVTHARVDFVKIADATVSAAPILSVVPVPPAVPHLPAPSTEFAPLRSAATAQTVERGWIDVPAAVALDVYEDGRHLGNTTDGRLRLPSGVHALDFVNDELGVRLRTSATVYPGKVTSVTPALPSSTIAVSDAPAHAAGDLRE